jgi:hypothetical protein
LPPKLLQRLHQQMFAQHDSLRLTLAPGLEVAIRGYIRDAELFKDHASAGQLSDYFARPLCCA